LADEIIAIDNQVYGHGSKWTCTLSIIIREHELISIKLAPTIILLKLSGFHPNTHIRRSKIKKIMLMPRGFRGATGIFSPRP
jgi:hypothetical protein